MMQTLIQDLRYGARMLRTHPGFSLIAIVTLALGIGANTAIFSVVNGVLLRPLAYREPDRIVTLLHAGRSPISPANFLDLQAGSRSFERIAAAEAWGGALTDIERPEQIAGLRMGEGLFEMLGVPPLLGRTLQPEDYAPGGGRVLVLSHKLWQRVFGGDAGVIGRRIRLSGESYAIVGVMPPQFQFPPFWSTRAEMWTPLDLASRSADRRASSLRVFARLRPEAALAQARAEAELVSRRLATDHPEANVGLDIRVDPLNEKVVGPVRPILLSVWATVAAVLLIACANVACLLLARAAARRREIAVRGAMGASRGRILRQMLTESLLLSLCGAAGGLLLAVWGVNGIASLLAGNSTGYSVRLPRLSEVQLDPTALVFTLSVSLLCALLFGLAPALLASRADLNPLLKAGSRGALGGRGRLREALVVAELALSLVLLIGAGLLLNSFRRLQAIDPGFDPRGTLTATISLAGAPQYAGPAREAFYQQLLARLRGVPGIEAASAINHLPLAGDTWGTDIVIEGRPLPPAGQDLNAAYRVSRPDYFRTMGIPFRAGRDFLDREAPGAVIVNETLAQRAWPSEDPIGKRLTLDNPRDASQPVQWLTVVGVTRDVKQDSWTNAPANEIYVPFAESGVFLSGTAPQFAAMSLVLRASVDPGSLSDALRQTVRGLDRTIPLSELVTMEQIVADALWQPRFTLQLIALFAALALALAVVGLYGVIAWSVAQRSHEIGLRLALGAQRRDVLRLIVGQGLRLALAGIALGLLASLALARAMTTLLYSVSATDPVTFASIAALLLAIALLAAYLPARRAARVDPMLALRGD